MDRTALAAIGLRASGVMRRRRRVRCQRLREPQPRDVAEQRRQAAAGPDLDDRAGPAALASSAAADRLGPGGLALGPDVLREQAAGTALRRGLDDLRRAPRRTRRDPDVDGLGAGVRRDDRVRRPEELLAEQVRDRRLADPRQPERPRRDVGAGAARPQPRQDVALPRSGASRAAARAGRRSPARPAARPTSAGAVPFAFGSAVRRRNQPGLLEVHRRHVHAAPAHRPRSQDSRPASIDRCLAGDARRSPRGSGRRASGRGRRSRRRDRRRARPSVERLPHRIEVVGECLDPAHRHADRRQAPGQLAGIRVAGLADGQLAADAQELRGRGSGEAGPSSRA